jgi:hypothetical protein
MAEQFFQPCLVLMDLMNFGVMSPMSIYPLLTRLWSLALSKLFHLAGCSVVPLALGILCNEMKKSSRLLLPPPLPLLPRGGANE